ncbi:33 kDa ribonucleoprotein, chloroplastic [Linum perenne]
MSALSMAASSVTQSPLRTKLSSNPSSAAYSQSSSHSFPSSKPFDFILLRSPLELANQATAASLFRPRRQFAAGSDDFEVDSGDDNITDEEVVSDRVVGPSNEGRTIFVNCLPLWMTAAEVTELFDGVGQVENVEVTWDPITNMSRGFGYVTMATAGEAASAMRMFNGSIIGGRTWRVSLAKEPSNNRREMITAPRAMGVIKGSSKQLVVKGFGSEITNQDLEQAFKDQPGYLRADIKLNLTTGKSLGFGLLCFRTEEDALAALTNMQGVVVKGQTLLLQRPVTNSRKRIHNSKRSPSTTSS